MSASNVKPRITYPHYRKPSRKALEAEYERAQRTPPAQLWRLQLDRVITRRKRYCLVVDPSGEVVHSEREAGLAFEYLENEGIAEYLLEYEKGQWLIQTDRLDAKRRIS